MRMSRAQARAQARALGIPVPKRHRLDFQDDELSSHAWNIQRGKKSKAHLDAAGDKLFLAACKAHGLPIPVAEYRFAAPDRNWRIDWLFEGWLALEIEGSPWIGTPCPVCKQRSGGRHNHGQGFLDDIEKYNELTIRGYALIRCTREQIEKGSAFALIRRALDARGEQP